MERNLLTLADGTDFIKSYIGLLNMRYDNTIVLHADNLHGDRNECILSLSLQLIIENAVKHNCPQNGTELHVSIGRQGDMLVIKNNRIYTNQPNDQSIESYGIGISNLKQRYRLEGEADILKHQKTIMVKHRQIIHLMCRHQCFFIDHQIRVYRDFSFIGKSG